MITLNGLYYPAWDKKQTNLLFLSAHIRQNQDSPDKNTAHTTPAAQLCKSNAIMGQLFMSTIQHKFQENLAVFLFPAVWLFRFKMIDLTDIAPSQTNHPTKKQCNTEVISGKCTVMSNMPNKQELTAAQWNLIGNQYSLITRFYLYEVCYVQLWNQTAYIACH